MTRPALPHKQLLAFLLGVALRTSLNRTRADLICRLGSLRSNCRYLARNHSPVYRCIKRTHLVRNSTASISSVMAVYQMLTTFKRGLNPSKGDIIQVALSCELGVDDVRVLMPIVNAHPHLYTVSHPSFRLINVNGSHTLRKVLRPARMLPPIQVEYLRSGGAKIFILISLTATFCSSVNNRSPKPLVRVLPPDKTILLYRDFLRSRSTRLIASATIWCTPGYSSPIISGSNKISGALKRSAPICQSRLANSR